MIATTIEQSERLLACGVKAETADMYRHNNSGELYCDNYSKFVANTTKEHFYSPAWSLSALLTEVLPRRLCGTNLCFIFDENECEINYSLEDSIGRTVILEDKYNDVVQVFEADPIEACVKMVELLHEKGLLPSNS